ERQRTRDDATTARRLLCRRPELDLAVFEQRRRVLRFERRVRDERIEIRALGLFRGRAHCGVEIAVLSKILMGRLLRQNRGLRRIPFTALRSRRAFVPRDVELSPRLLDQPPVVADDGYA